MANTARTTLIFLLPSLLLLAFPAAAQTRCLSAVPLAERILNDEASWGSLPLAGYYSLDEALLDQGRLRATVDARLDIAVLRTRGATRLGKLCVAVVADVEGEVKAVHERPVEVEGLGSSLEGVSALGYHVRADLPEGTSELLLLVQLPDLEAFAAMVLEDSSSDKVSRPGPGAVRLAGSEEAWYEIERGTAAASAAVSSKEVVLRLVPPRNQPATGGTRFDALVSTDAVRRVVFELDGEKVADQRHRPFVARLDLAKPARLQIVRAIAYDNEDHEIGSDEITVNDLDVPFRVRIDDVTQTLEGLDWSARVSVPQEAQLDRVEVYLNELLVKTFAAPPYAGRLPVLEPGPEEYIRVAAYLKDGASIDDVVLLASPAVMEEVEVNLVEVQVVVTDAEGKVVKDLKPDEFEVIHRGQRRQIASFSYADDVPLMLGIVIDTSGSMRLVMDDTRRAAAKFLGQTVLPQDRAFIVDFDKRPRLLQETTGDISRLLLSLGRLEAEGETAMYDAIVFSMLQFERQRGRKALVVLTDGDDRDSRYGPKHCVDFAHKTGVPVYIIGLGALDGFRRSYSKSDLLQTTEKTGGELYFVESVEALGMAYAEINAELRSQYTLTFYTDSDLTEEERREVEVHLTRPGLKARTVVGAKVQQ